MWKFCRITILISLVFFALSCGTDDNKKTPSDQDDPDMSLADMVLDDMTPDDMASDASTETCDDSVLNQDESDVDCGGSCDGCAIDENCSVDADCADDRCVAGVCAAPLKSIGEECVATEECAESTCEDIRGTDYCTTPCETTCDGSGLACFEGQCVSDTLCIDPDGDGLGEGPGCSGTPCDLCSDDATCASDTAGEFLCTCNEGFTGDGFDCLDVDECTTGAALCDTNASCNNLPGSYECTCDSGFEGDGTSCANIDECGTNTDTCHASATCTDTLGAFTCACNSGYAGDGFACANIDECATGAAGCSSDATCTDMPGTFSCDCLTGYSGDGFTCSDIDECVANSDNCAAIGGICNNNLGGFSCACESGYTGNGVTCTDINECTTNQDNCHAEATCNNNSGGFTCVCDSGYAGDGVVCTNINECNNPNACGANAVCFDYPGGFSCACGNGYEGNPNTGCTDIDECSVNPNICATNATCTNRPSTYDCACDAGFLGDGFNNCANVDECTNGTATCDANATCTDTQGSYDCACDTGYGGDGFTCMADGDVCANPWTIGALPFTGNGDTSAATNDYSFSSGTCPGESSGWGAGSPDEAWTFTPQTSGWYAITLDADYDSLLYVVTDCANEDTTCLAAADETGVVESVDLELVAGNTYFIIADGYGNTTSQSGTYTLTVDTNECLETADLCPGVAQCVNTLAGYDCECPDGYTLDAGACVDIDECLSNTDDCDVDATCTNTAGGFTCECTPPLSGSGTDCWDPTPLGESCVNPYIVGALPYSVTGYDTSDNHPDYSYSDGVCPGVGSGWGAMSNDEAFQFTAPAAGTFRFELDATFDSTLYVVSDCGSVDTTCLGGADSAIIGIETVDVTMTMGQVVFVIVDGYSNISNITGTYDLSITSVP